MSEKMKVIHIGKQEVKVQELFSKYEYQWIPLSYDFKEDLKQTNIFYEGNYHPQLYDAIFVIEKYAKILTQNELLCQLPAHRIIYDQEIKVRKDTERILLLKGAHRQFIHPFLSTELFINDHYSAKQLGYKLNPNHLMVSSNFKGEVNRKGNSYIELTGDFGITSYQIIIWKMTNQIEVNQRMDFFPEFEILEGALEVSFKLFLIRTTDGSIIDVLEISDEELKQKEFFTLTNQQEPVYLNISLYVKGGIGKMKVGAMHLRNALRKGNVLLPGGQRIFDSAGLNGEIISYFEPGDFKPPLAVYFSGYRSAEGFEGRKMMSRMGCPFLLIADPRLEGGNFYLGNESFEQTIITLIKTTLEQLYFSSDDLILSGLSMGTFGALYYAADLQPNSVIIGKPLANVGSISVNGRVRRPNDFFTGLDILFHATGAISPANAKKLDDRFWNKFRTGNYEKTLFAITYMKEDDYDQQAFHQIQKLLKTEQPKVRILHKGWTGRHNDNSQAINQWFLKQYRNVMRYRFQRE